MTATAQQETTATQCTWMTGVVQSVDRVEKSPHIGEVMISAIQEPIFVFNETLFDTLAQCLTEGTELRFYIRYETDNWRPSIHYLRLMQIEFVSDSAFI